jgi:hypothetical protein
MFKKLFRQKEVNQKIAKFHETLLVDGKVVIPANLIPVAELLKALLEVIKMFTNDKTDAIIDSIIEAIDLLD